MSTLVFGTQEPMTTRTNWTRQQLLVAFELYCRIPFGRITSGNPEILRAAQLIGRSSSALSMKMCNIASLDPAITSTGRRGLGNASRADRTMWEEMNSDWERFANESHSALIAVGLAEQSVNEEDLPPESNNNSGIDRPIVTTARVGQTFFREAVLSAYNQQCCITGLAVPQLLVASHIVPWRIDNVNRVNPRNGLLLSALHDRAFDAGLLTIDENMAVMVSPGLSKDSFFSSALESYHGKPIRLPERFHPDPEFLGYHRLNIFES